MPMKQGMAVHLPVRMRSIRVVLLALVRLYHAVVANVEDELEAHVGNGRARIESTLLLHLADNGFDCLFLVPTQLELLDEGLVALDDLACGKPDGQLCRFGSRGDDVRDCRVATAQAVVVVAGKVDDRLRRRLTMPGDVDRVTHDFFHALARGGADGHHGYAEHPFHAVDVHRAPVTGELVHHVERDHGGNPHLEALHGEVEVALDVGGVHDVDDAEGMLVEHELAAHQLLARVRRERVDAGQVGDDGIGIVEYYAILAVHRDAGEVAHVLVRPRELVEEGRLAAVLVANERVREHRVIGQRFCG